MKYINAQTKIKYTKYVFMESGKSYNDIQTTKKILSDGTEATQINETRYRALDSIYTWSENFKMIESLIGKLAKEPGLLIPQFLLRAQLIEFALKHLLLHAPYKPVGGLGKKPIEKMTMGDVINKLDACNDSHLKQIIEAAQRFKDLRNEITHHLIHSEKSKSEIEEQITQKMELAKEIEKQIIYFIDYVEDTLGAAELAKESI